MRKRDRLSGRDLVCSPIFPFNSALIFLSLLGAAVIFEGCSEKSGRQVIKPQDVEVISVKDQALEEIQRTPSEFVLDYSRNVAAWQRALAFFKLYAGAKRPEDYVIDADEIYTTPHADADFSYRVSRTFEPGGVRIKVECYPKPGRPDFAAQRNEKNLARFIREGTLELSWLER